MANPATVATANVYGSNIISSTTVIFSNVGVISSSAGINVAPVNIAIFSNLPTSVNVSSSKQQSYSYGF